MASEGAKSSMDASRAATAAATGFAPRPAMQASPLTGRTFVLILHAMSNDRSYLTSLQDYYARHRALPSYASIGGLLGLRSKSSVAALVARLKLAGFLDSTPDRRLAPTRRFFARPLAESPVRAGMPEADRGRRCRRPHHRRLPDRAPVLHGADPREGRLDDGRRHLRRRPRGGRKEAQRPQRRDRGGDRRQPVHAEAARPRGRKVHPAGGEQGLCADPARRRRSRSSV